MLEVAVGVAVVADDLAAEFCQEFAAERPARAAVAVEEHAEPAGGDGRDADLVAHQLPVVAAHVRRRRHAAGAVPTRPPELAAAVQLGDDRTLIRRQHRAVGAEQFQPVPRRRVVTRGDLDRARGAQTLDRDAHGRRRANANVGRLAPRAQESGDDGVLEGVARGARVARDQDAAAAEVRPERPGEAARGLNSE